MQRTAACSCGRLSATTKDNPARIAICHCLECQRMSGSAFAALSFWRKSDVVTTGDHKSFRRSSDAGRWLETHLLP